jgi:hypothetical protein
MFDSIARRMKSSNQGVAHYDLPCPIGDMMLAGF